MDSTLQIVLITIASVHLLNFIALAMDEEFGWRYEDYAKRFCCLSIWFIVFIIVLLPLSIVKKIERRKRRKPRYVVDKTFLGKKWDVPDLTTKIAVSTSYNLAFECINKDLRWMREEHPNELENFRREYDDIFMAGDEDGYAIKYEIKEQW